MTMVEIGFWFIWFHVTMKKAPWLAGSEGARAGARLSYIL
jgi:hypothetical protein